MVGAHDGVNIAKALMKVLEDWEINSKSVGISVSDNAKNNNTTVKT